MATVKIDQFHGMLPRSHPTLLADGMAVTAHNVKLKSGKLVPLRQPKPVSSIPIRLENGLSDVSGAKSLHVWRASDGNIEMLAFPGITWVAEGNIADDDKYRVIVSGDTGVCFTDDEGKTFENAPQIYLRGKTGERIVHQICKNSLPRPKVKRTDGSSELDSANKRYTYFFFTWVDEYGYESPVSESSLSWNGTSYVDETLEYNDGDTIEMQSIADYDVPEEAVCVRVYKVVSGTETGNIQFVAEFSRSEATSSSSNMLVRVADEDAGEVITEIEAPPGNLKNVIRVFGGGYFYAGFSSSNPKSVCFSEVNLIYSWPMAYRYDVDGNIVALATTSNTVFALTDGFPYVMSGTSPDGMTVYPLAGPAACVSARSVCVYKNAVYFASNEGICTIYNNADSGMVVTNITDQIWTKDQWNALNPSSCAIVQHDGVLHCWFDTAEGNKSYSIDLLESSRSVTTNDEPASCACVDAKTDKLYFVRA